MHQMVRAAFLLVLSAVLLLHSHATAQSPQSVADVQISSVSGCVDVYPITVNCTLATTLHIHTSTGFPSTVDWYWRPLYIRAEIDGQEYFSLSRVWLDPSDATNSTALVNVTSTTYWPHITGVLVSVRFIDYWDAIPGTGTVASSAPFAAFSFLFEGAPTLTAISGCDGSGQLTQNCVPDATTITLVGSGLRWYAGRGPWLTIGSQKSSSGAQVSVFNDTCMTVSLDWVYGVLLKPQHYAGVVLPFSLSSVVYSAVSGKSVTAYTTNALSISFVPLPPPNITSWYLVGCAENNASLPAFTNCRPGLSYVYLFGSYLYDVQVNVGGAPCPRIYTYAAYYTYCRLPAFDYDPSVHYDLVVYNDAGRIPFTGLIQYTSQPTLASIDACVDRGDLDTVWYEGAACPVWTTITLRGSRFMPTADSVTVKFVSGANSNVSLTWSSPTLLNSSAITVTLTPLNNPVAAAAVYGQSGSLTVAFTTGNITTTSNTLASILYAALDQPNITAVTSTGCTSLSPLQLTNCRAMAAITITGNNLAPYNTYNVQPFMITSALGEYQGNNVLVARANDTFSTYSNSTLVFTLLYFDANTEVDLLPDTVYTIYLYTTGTRKDSNAFRLSLTYGLDDSNASQSAKRLSAGGIAGVVVAAVVVVAVLLAGVVWVVQRRMRGGGGASSSKPAVDGLQWSLQSSGKQSMSSSDDYKDVELH